MGGAIGRLASTLMGGMGGPHARRKRPKHCNGTSGLIVIALLETLLDKNVIALAEARHILQRAVNSLSPARTTEEQEALKILGGMQRGYFSERC